MDAQTLQQLARTLHRWHVPLVPELLCHAIRLLHHAELPFRATIGAGTVLAHGGMSIAMDPETVIGRGCVIGEQVSFSKGGDLPGAPVVEDFVVVEPGAALVGGVRIGRGAHICANVHVRQDVPPGMRVERDLYHPVGQPAPRPTASPGARSLNQTPGVNELQRRGEPLFGEPAEPGRPAARPQDPRTPEPSSGEGTPAAS